MPSDTQPAQRGTIKHLFDAALVADVRARVGKLREESRPQWGGLTVGGMLAHCTVSFDMAMGVIQPRRAPFPGNVVGLLIKPLVFGNDRPIRRNVPSLPELIPAQDAAFDFERERGRLLEGLTRFANGGAACCSRHPHPFFGVLKPQQWAILMYKHTDHHLRQFGV